jgi:hypothetical protein
MSTENKAVSDELKKADKPRRMRRMRIWVNMAVD